MTSLLGRNGTGKTTLLRVLATLQHRYLGDVTVLNRNPRVARERREIRKHLGFLPQDFRFNSSFTVTEFIDYALWLREVPSNLHRSRRDQVIEETDLTRHRNKKLGSLSGGTLQRAGIAQSIANDPALLLLDEPSAGLDPEQRIRLRNLLASLSDHRRILVSTHLLEEATVTNSHVIVLAEGRLVFSGTSMALADYDDGHSPGDTALERAYSRLQASAFVKGDV